MTETLKEILMKLPRYTVNEIDDMLQAEPPDELLNEGQLVLVADVLSALAGIARQQDEHEKDTTRPSGAVEHEQGAGSLRFTRT